MANRIGTLLGNLAGAFDALVAAGTLSAVERRVINPLTETRTSVLGLSLARFSRDRSTGTWEGQVLLQLRCRSGATVDDELVELAAQVDAAIDAMIDAGQAGGHVDQVVWDPWYVRTNDGQYQTVGAIGGLRFTVETPLVIGE